jgi:hypothetical protein
MPNRNASRTLVRQSCADRRWHVNCPCGFTWRARYHRTALLMAVNHTHELVA